MSHLTDETLNEYLDAALAPVARAAAADHLAQCAPCAARLTALQRLVVGFDALTVPPLARDLSAAVLASLPQRPSTLRQPAFWPALNWVFAAQAFAAAVLLALAWPLISALTSAWTEPAASLGRSLRVAFDQMQAWAALAGDPTQTITQMWSTLQAAWASLGLEAALRRPAAWMGPVEAGLLVTAAALLWLAGNIYLLRQPLSSFLRRRT